MYHEYAIHPECFSKWENCRFFCAQMGWDNGRLLSVYPKNWFKKAYESIEACGEMEKKNIVENLTLLKKYKSIKRYNAVYNDVVSWEENCLKQHSEIPYRGIVSNNETSSAKIVKSKDIHINHEKWKLNTQITRRNAEDIARRFSLLLKASKRILFVDPYIRAADDRFMRVITRCIMTAMDSIYRDKEYPIIEIHTKIKDSMHAELKLAVNNFTRNLPEKLPKGIEVDVKIWGNKPGGDEFHDRFILTDLGGIFIGAGLSEGRDYSYTANTNRQDFEQYLLRFSQYTGDTPDYNLLEEFNIKSSS